MREEGSFAGPLVYCTESQAVSDVLIERWVALIDDMDACLAPTLGNLVGAGWRVHQALHLHLVMPWPGSRWLEVVLVVF